MQLPVCLCDGVRANERLVWEHAPITRRVDRPIYYDVRHMDALQSKNYLTYLPECYASAADRPWSCLSKNLCLVWQHAAYAQHLTAPINIDVAGARAHCLLIVLLRWTRS